MKRFDARLPLGLSALALALLAGAGGSLSYFAVQTQAQKNQFEPVAVDIGVTENGSLLEEQTQSGFATGTPKTVQLTNKDKTDNVDTYLRCALVPVWRWASGRDAGTGAGVQMGDYTLSGDRLTAQGGGATLTLWLAEGWQEAWTWQSDGWFYYQGAAAPGQSTPALLERVEYTAPEGVTLEVQVLADGVQAVGTGLPDWTRQCGAPQSGRGTE